jgi:hypothetical protein
MCVYMWVVSELGTYPGPGGQSLSQTPSNPSVHDPTKRNFVWDDDDSKKQAQHKKRQQGNTYLTWPHDMKAISVIALVATKSIVR